MKYKQIILLAVMLLGVTAARTFAGENISSTDNSTEEYKGGFVEMQYRIGNTSGSRAMASEYLQRNDGPAAQTRFDWRKELYELTIGGQFSADVSGDTPSDTLRHVYDLNALFRKSRHYSVEAYSERFGHNLSDGKTDKQNVHGHIYARDANTTSEFTYNRQRTKSGFKAEASFDTPFFASVAFDNLAVRGLLPLYGVNGANVPYPLDYEVNTLTGEFGYQSDLFTALVHASVDSLEDDLEKMRASRTEDGELSGETRRPVQESSSYSLGGALTYRIPTLYSTAMLNGSFSHLTSDSIASSLMRRNTAATMWDTYEGDIKTISVNGALSSSLWKGANSRLYGRYYQRDNDSKIEYNEERLKTITAAFQAGTKNRDRMANYEYEKRLLGAELNQRLGQYRLQGGVEWEGTHRNAYGITRVRNTDDLELWGQVRAALTETISGHVRYGFLDRTSSDVDDVTNGEAVMPSSGVIAPWFNYMDTASKHSQSVKSGVEWNPVDSLTLSLDYVLTLDDYNGHDPLGLQRGIKHGGIADIAYAVGPAQLHLYGSVERGETKMNTRLYSGTTADLIGGANPRQPDTETAFNWGYTEYDTTYTLGTGATIDLIEDVLVFQLSYDYTKNDGKTNLRIPKASGVTRDGISHVNDYTLHNLNAKLTYSVDQHQSLGLGYTFSKLDYDDWSYNSKVTNENRLADGYYNVDPNYEAHIAGIFYRYTF